MKKLGFVVVAALMLAGCGGGGSTTTPAPAPVATPTPTAAPVVPSGIVLLAVNGTAATATPAALTLAAAGSTATAIASEVNYTGAFTAVSANAAIVTVSGTSPTFLLTAAGGGTTTVTFTDSAAKSTVLTVNVTNASMTLSWALDVSAGKSPPLFQVTQTTAVTSSVGVAQTLNSGATTQVVPPATTAAATAASIVPGQAIVFAPSQSGQSAGFTGSLTACPAGVTMTPASGAVASGGTLTVSSLVTTPAATTCVVTVTGQGGQSITTAVTINAIPLTLTLNGVVGTAIQLAWLPPNAPAGTNPFFGPVNIIGPGAVYADTIVASHINWMPNVAGRAFTAAIAAPGGGACPVAAIAAVAGSNTSFTVTGNNPAAPPASFNCTVTISDTSGAAAATITVTYTSLTGTVQ